MKKKLLLCLLALGLLLPALPVSAAPAPLRLLMSDDLQALGTVLTAYAAAQPKAPKIEVSFKDVADIQSLLQSQNCPYDAVWLSNSIPLSLLSGGQRITNSRFTAVSPVVFAVRQSKAEALGLTGELSMSDIVSAIRSGQLTFVLPSVTQTNSGLSAYLGFLSALSGKPAVLTLDHLHQPALEEELTALFAGVERSSGSEDYAADLVKRYGYDCLVASEASVIRLNQQLVAAGQEPLRLLYPSDGVTMADTPLAYINQGDAAKQSAFLALQNYVLSEVGQEQLARLGLRTDIGGLIAPEHYDIFREEWGIRRDVYINTIVYPAKAFINEALGLYQNLFRKPSYTVFCLDYSGSMFGDGHKQLLAAMAQLLDPASATAENLQFTARDRLALVIFNSNTVGVLEGTGDQSLQLLKKLRSYGTDGSTQLHAALLDCTRLFAKVDPNQYTLSIVAMTDGAADLNGRASYALTEAYTDGSVSVPIYSIMFGGASDSQLKPLAEMSKGEVFDGRQDLKKAFRKVRGYN